MITNDFETGISFDINFQPYIYDAGRPYTFGLCWLAYM